jgi:hypothetical protein
LDYILGDLFRTTSGHPVAGPALFLFEQPLPSHSQWVRNASATRLPDDMFSNQKSLFGEILEGLAIEDVGIF